MKTTSFLVAGALLSVGIAWTDVPALPWAQAQERVAKPAANNVLRNPKFLEVEGGLPVGWNAFEGGFKLAPGEGYRKSTAISVARAEADTARGISQSVILDQKEAAPITLSGWSRAEEVSGAPDNDYAIYADLTYADGTNGWGFFAPFQVGTGNWNQAKTEIKPEKAVKSLIFYALFRKHTGRALFSDLSVSVAGVSVPVPVAPQVAPQNASVQAAPKVLAPIVGQKNLAANPFKATIPATGAAFKVVPVEHDNRLLNPALEGAAQGVPANWRKWNEGFELREGEGRGGKRAVFIERGAGDGERGIGQELVLDQKDARPVLISGWSRAEEVTGNADVNYSLYADLLFQDGSEKWGESVPFATGTHGWQEASLLITPEAPLKSIKFYALFRGHTGRVWFSDLSVGSERAPAGAVIFDSLAVQNPPQRLPRTPIQKGALVKPKTFRTGDGLALEMADNRVTSLQIGGREVASSAPSGFLVRDVANASDFHPLRTGRNDALKLQLETQISAATDHITVEGRIADLSGQDRAISLVFALPVEARGWNWGQTLRESQRVAGDEYSNTVAFSAGSNGRHSLYPFANISDAQSGLAIAVDPDFAAQNRLAVNAGTRQFYLVYDFGLTPEKRDARFRFVIYRTDPNWGFRDALAKLGRIFPAMFALSPAAKNQGLWMPFTDIRKVEGWQDFGFRFRETLTEASNADSLKWDAQNGILSFRYYEPASWWMNMAADVPRTYENALAGLQKVASDPSDANYAKARAVLSSGFRDATGRYAVRFDNQPWASGAVWSLNMDPKLSADSTGASLGWNAAMRETLAKNDPQFPLAGEYLDSLEGYVTANLDFDREHFKVAESPLTFDTATNRPAQHKGLLAYDYTRWESRQVRALGKMMFANSVPSHFTFLAPSLDIMGTEVNWLPDGKWTPEGDGIMSLRRAMSGPKPYLLLQNTDFEKFTVADTEKYMQRALFYGMFPGFFSADAATKPYWENPQWYGRDRATFKKYVPMVKSVAEAGWQALTLAKSDDSAVWVERFGGETGPLYLTVFNSAATPHTARLTLQAPLAAPAQLHDEVSGKAATIRNGTIEIALEAEQTAVLKLR